MTDIAHAVRAGPDSCPAWAIPFAFVMMPALSATMRSGRGMAQRWGEPVAEEQEGVIIDDGLLRALRPGLIRFARLQLRDDALAEDVVQDALMSAMAGAKGFAGRAALNTWVLAILRNKIADAIRLRSRSINVSALAPEEESLDQAFEALFKPNAHWSPQSRPRDWGDPEDALQRDQFWIVFEACLEHLPENTARVFMMREFLEFDTAEICKELAISSGNCHVILHRARNALRGCLEENWFDQGAPAC
ncbi:MAG: sigma-70 family RNA polymerase sigma factor [Rhodocyclaceae bacterium]